jgi:hypothetical protein
MSRLRSKIVIASSPLFAKRTDRGSPESVRSTSFRYTGQSPATKPLSSSPNRSATFPRTSYELFWIRCAFYRPKEREPRPMCRISALACARCLIAKNMVASPKEARVPPDKKYSSAYGPECLMASISKWAPVKQKKTDKAIQKYLGGLILHIPSLFCLHGTAFRYGFATLGGLSLYALFMLSD